MVPPQIGLKKTFWLKKFKILHRGLQSKEVVAMLYEKELRKFRVEKVIKRKGDKLYFKLKAYDNSINNWIDKKDIILKNKLISRIIYP